MCNAYNLKASMAAIGEASLKQLGLPLLFPPGVTAATSNVPVPEAVYPRRDGLILKPTLLREAGEAEREGPPTLEPALAHWNLTPFFHKGPLKAWKASTNNCRSETMASSPTFREAFRRRRCLIPATSFTEWTGPKGKKTAHQIGLAWGGIFFLAGLFERCRVEEAWVESYTMVMMPAAGLVARFHDRSPVILGKNTAFCWLDPAQDCASLLAAPAEGILAAEPPEPVAA
ncbi:MAG: SOS response-associated peptidase [Caulobacteraceae bacterium]